MFKDESFTSVQLSLVLASQKLLTIFPLTYRRKPKWILSSSAYSCPWVAGLLTCSKPLIFNFLFKLHNKMEGFKSGCLPFHFMLRKFLTQTNLGSKTRLILYSLLHTSNYRTTPYLISLIFSENISLKEVMAKWADASQKCLFAKEMFSYVRQTVLRFNMLGDNQIWFLLFLPSKPWLYLSQLCISPTTEMDVFQLTPCFPQPGGIQLGNKLPHTIFHLLGQNLWGLGQLQSEKMASISYIPPGKLWSPCSHGSAFKILFLCTFMNLQCK